MELGFKNEGQTLKQKSCTAFPQQLPVPPPPQWERAHRPAFQRESLGVSPEVAEGAATGTTCLCVGTLQKESGIEAALL